MRENLTKITMKKMLLLSIWLLSEAVRCQQPKIHLLAQEGERVKISCSYDRGYETYPKYFSKGDYGKRRALIKTSGKKFEESSQKGKYHICDDTKQRILHVTIRNLNLNDGGTYWCEIDAYTFDPITEINLRVNRAPAPPKPPPVTSDPPISTTVTAIDRNQQQSARTTVSETASSTTLWSTSPEDMHHTAPFPEVLPPLAGKELCLVVAAAAVLLLSLFVVLYFVLRKHRHDTGREFECEADPWINTYSTEPIHAQNHSWGQLSESDPSVNVSSSDSMYAAVTSRRGPGSHTSICHPVTIQTKMSNPVFNSSISSRLQDDASAQIINQCEESICSVSSPSTEAGYQHINEDVHLLYSTVCLITEAAAQPREQIRAAAGPSELYATIRHPKT